MTPVADNQVVVPERQIEEERKPGASEPPRTAARSAAGRHAEKTNDTSTRSH